MISAMPVSLLNSSEPLIQDHLRATFPMLAPVTGEDIHGMLFVEYENVIRQLGGHALDLGPARCIVPRVTLARLRTGGDHSITLKLGTREDSPTG